MEIRPIRLGLASTVLRCSYITFIRARPHVHDLAYGPLVAQADHPLLQQAAIAYWDLPHDIVA